MSNERQNKIGEISLNFDNKSWAFSLEHDLSTLGSLWTSLPRPPIIIINYCGKLRAVPSPEHFAHFPWPHPRDLKPTTSPSTSRLSTALRRIPNGGDAPTRALLTRAHHRVWPTCLPCLPCVGKHDRLLRRRAAGRGRGRGVPVHYDSAHLLLEDVRAQEDGRPPPCPTG